MQCCMTPSRPGEVGWLNSTASTTIRARPSMAVGRSVLQIVGGHTGVEHYTDAAGMPTMYHSRRRAADDLPDLPRIHSGACGRRGQHCSEQAGTV